MGHSPKRKVQLNGIQSKLCSRVTISLLTMRIFCICSHR